MCNISGFSVQEFRLDFDESVNELMHKCQQVSKNCKMSTLQTKLYLPLSTWCKGMDI